MKTMKVLVLLMLLISSDVFSQGGEMTEVQKQIQRCENIIADPQSTIGKIYIAKLDGRTCEQFVTGQAGE